MKKVLFILLSAVMISSCCTSNSGNIKLQKVSPESVGMCSERLQLADSVINQAIAKSEIPGAVLAVVRGDKIAYLKAYGNKQVYPDTVKMTENTIFDLASVSKCVGTTLSFLQLVENGKVRLTDPVEMYIPGFQQWVDPETGRKTSIRVQDLLSHSSGILPYINTASYLKKYGPATPDSLIKHIAQELPLKYKPTTGYTYSCLNFITLQNILQNVTGMKLYQYAQQNVFGALGLKHTSYLPLDAADRQEALSTVTPDFLSLVAPTEVENGKVILGEVHDPTARLVNMGNSGNAGVFSNAEDLAVIAAAILNKGEVKGRRVLSPLMVETMMTNPKTNDPSIERNLGWDTYTTGAGTKGDIFLTQPNTFVHTGYTGTSMLFDIDNNCCVILLTNRVHPSDAAGVVARTRGVVANIVAASIME
ncbi:MAG: serine hydrolase [Bacteroidales bacterium]|nr:serine hydrolase [Bacteroidales bacterium]